MGDAPAPAPAPGNLFSNASADFNFTYGHWCDVRQAWDHDQTTLRPFALKLYREAMRRAAVCRLADHAREAREWRQSAKYYLDEIGTNEAMLTEDEKGGV